MKDRVSTPDTSMKDPESRLTKTPDRAGEIAMRAIADLYNAAQRDVL